MSPGDEFAFGPEDGEDVGSGLVGIVRTSLHEIMREIIAIRPIRVRVSRIGTSFPCGAPNIVGLNFICNITGRVRRPTAEIDDSFKR